MLLHIWHLVEGMGLGVIVTGAGGGQADTGRLASAFDPERTCSMQIGTPNHRL